MALHERRSLHCNLGGHLVSVQKCRPALSRKSSHDTVVAQTHDCNIIHGKQQTFEDAAVIQAATVEPGKIVKETRLAQHGEKWTNVLEIKIEE